MTEFHRLFDEALGKVRSELGNDHPMIIDGKTVGSDRPAIEEKDG